MVLCPVVVVIVIFAVGRPIEIVFSCIRWPDCRRAHRWIRQLLKRGRLVNHFYFCYSVTCISSAVTVIIKLKLFSSLTKTGRCNISRSKTVVKKDVMLLKDLGLIKNLCLIIAISPKCIRVHNRTCNNSSGRSSKKTRQNFVWWKPLCKLHQNTKLQMSQSNYTEVYQITRVHRTAIVKANVGVFTIRTSVLQLSLI